MRRLEEVVSAMTKSNEPRIGRMTVRCLLAVALAMTVHQAQAATAGADKKPAAASASPQSTSVVINLIRLLVQEGVLTQDKANLLIRQAEDEAASAARGQIAVNQAPAPGA